MSKPSNPLARYRTYAYHQFLAVTDSSQTAEALSNSDEVNDFRSNFETDLLVNQSLKKLFNFYSKNTRARRRR